MFFFVFCSFRKIAGLPLPNYIDSFFCWMQQLPANFLGQGVVLMGKQCTLLWNGFVPPGRWALMKKIVFALAPGFKNPNLFHIWKGQNRILACRKGVDWKNTPTPMHTFSKCEFLVKIVIHVHEYFEFFINICSNWKHLTRCHCN